MAKDAQVRTAHPIYGQGSHCDRQKNGDTLWWDAILQEMKNLRPSFEAYEGNKEDLPPGYQQIKCHMLFDIKLGDNFRRKAQLVVGGHTTTAPSSIKLS